jgi:hypothetical protein
MSDLLESLTFCGLPVLVAAIWFWAIVGSHPYVRTLFKRTREWHRRAHGRCPACGYDLRGSAGGPCPECGS